MSYIKVGPKLTGDYGPLFRNSTPVKGTGHN